MSEMRILMIKLDKISLPVLKGSHPVKRYLSSLSCIGMDSSALVQFLLFWSEREQTCHRLRTMKAKNSHTPGDRQKVAQFMCHDTSTADRFYAHNLDAKQVAEHRRLFEAAVEGEDTAPGSPKAGKRLGKSSGKPPSPARRQPVGGARPKGIRSMWSGAVLGWW